MSKLKGETGTITREFIEPGTGAVKQESDHES